MLRGRLESNPNRLAINEISRLWAGPPAPGSLTFYAQPFHTHGSITGQALARDSDIVLLDRPGDANAAQHQLLSGDRAQPTARRSSSTRRGSCTACAASTTSVRPTSSSCGCGRTGSCGCAGSGANLLLLVELRRRAPEAIDWRPLFGARRRQQFQGPARARRRAGINCAPATPAICRSLALARAVFEVAVAD